MAVGVSAHRPSRAANPGRKEKVARASSTCYNKTNKASKGDNIMAVASVQLNFRITVELNEKIEALVTKETTKTEIVRKALEEYVDKQGKGDK
jgi:hypothetical protein